MLRHAVRCSSTLLSFPLVTHSHVSSLDSRGTHSPIPHLRPVVSPLDKRQAVVIPRSTTRTFSVPTCTCMCTCMRVESRVCISVSAFYKVIAKRVGERKKILNEQKETRRGEERRGEERRDDELIEEADNINM